MKTKEKVFERIKNIPKGEIITYKELARDVDSSPRAVAKILSTNKHPIIIPCHRVIKSNYELGGYTFNGKYNPEMKKELLSDEGIKIIKNKI